MRRLLVAGIGALLVGAGQSPAPVVPAAPSASRKADFEHDVAPLLKSHCEPCHYPGGKVYDKMPFDRAETVRKLGTKLFTRIKDEKEQQLIRDFLSQKDGEAKPSS